MTDDKTDDTKIATAYLKRLKQVFDDKPDEINVWTPDKDGQAFIGKLVDSGVSIEFGTPFLVFEKEDGLEHTVFIKMGMINTFIRKKWLTNEGQWHDGLVDNNVGKLMAFRYEGTERNPKTKRDFQKYKILFPSELVEANLDKWK